MALPGYKKVVLIGATSGIGHALAKRFAESDPATFTIAVGRRKENLDSLVQQYGHDKVQSVPFDITQLESIPHFVKNITSTHPDIDAVIMNSGIQRKADWTDPDSIDLDTIQQEFMTNYFSYIALTKAFLAHLKKRGEEGHETRLIFLSSGLALLPLPRVSNYCATKAALHHTVLCLRESLRDTKVKIIEVYPPAVQTELHDTKHQPDLKDNVGRGFGMPLDEFIENMWNGLKEGKENIPVGLSVNSFEGFEKKRMEMFSGMVANLKKQKK